MKLKMGAELRRSIVEDVGFEDGRGRVLLMASVDIRKKRKYMFCAGNYHL